MWVIKAFTVWLLIDILTLDRPLIKTQIDTQYTPSTLHQLLGWHLPESQLIYNWCIWVCQCLDTYQLTVDQVSMECQPSINWDVNRVWIGMSTEYQLRGYWSILNLRHLYYTRSSLTSEQTKHFPYLWCIILT